MSHQESGCAVEYSCYKNKPSIKYLENNLEQILKGSNAKCVGITCVYDPNNVSIEEAWEKIVTDTQKLHDKIEKFIDVVFIMSAIEIHGPKKARAKKPKQATYDGSKEEEKSTEGSTTEKKKSTKKKFKHAIDLSTTEFYKEESKKLRESRMERDYLEDKLMNEVHSGLMNQVDMKRELKQFDDDHGLVATQRTCSNGRTLMLDAETFFRIEWSPPEDLSKLDRYFIVKEVDDGKDTGVSLEGYPHFHVAVCQANIGGIIDDVARYGPIVTKIFGSDIEDIQIGQRKGKGIKLNWDDPRVLLGYIMKNSRHLDVDKRLGPNKKFHTVTNLIRSPKAVCELFHKLSSMNNRMTIINEIEGDEPFKEITTKKGDTPLEKAYGRIKFIMEQNKYRLCNGKIYEKVKGSKMTWRVAEEDMEFDGKIDFFMGSVRTQENLFLIPLIPGIKDTMKEKNQSIFPSINLDCQWLEFGDCFLCMPLGAIIKENDKYPCVGYFPEILHADIVNDKVAFPVKFMEIIDNSIKDPTAKKALCDKLFELYLPRIHKDPVLYLLGEPNSGKTTLIEAVTKLLPSDRRMGIADSNFALQEISDKWLLLIDENQGVVRQTTSIMLKLLEGDAELPLDVKHGAPISAKVNMNIIIASNDDLYAVDMSQQSIAHSELFPNSAPILIVDKNAAMNARLLKYTFKPLQNRTIGGKDLVMQERGRIILWLAKNYHSELRLNPDQKLIESEYEDWRSKNKRYARSKINVSAKIEMDD